MIETCQLIELTFTEQRTPIMSNNPYRFSQKFQIDFPEIKNSMNKSRKNIFILNWTDLISDRLTNELVKIVQRWREIEHNEIILVHSNELHAVSPNPRWNPLKHYDTHSNTHNSSRNPIKKSLTITLYKEMKDEINTPGKRMQKSDLD